MKVKRPYWLWAVLLGSALFLGGCSSIYMTAEDRFQKEYERGEDVVLESLEELTAVAYQEIPCVPYSLESVVRGLSALTEEEIVEYKKIDEHGLESLRLDNSEQYIDFWLLYGNTGFRFLGVYGGEQYESAVRQFTAGAEERSFAGLARQYPLEELEGLTKDEAIAICEEAINTAGLPFVYKQGFALDCDSMNRLHDEKCEEFGEGNWLGAPGSWAEVTTDGIVSDIKRWTTDQEAYALFFQMEFDGKGVNAPDYQSWLTICCRTDGRIVYAHCSAPAMDEQAGGGETRTIISSEEAYNIGRELLNQKGKTDAAIQSVQLEYSYGYSTETSRMLKPCWTVLYAVKVGDKEVVDGLYIDAVTGTEARTDAFY